VAFIRTILHIDLDAFFCSVEELFSPALKGSAFAVGGSPEGRGVVASCSYAARAYGIRSAMPMTQAVRLCPHLISVSHRFKAYGQYSRKIFADLEAITPNIEPVSIDECYLDVTDMAEDVEVLTENIRNNINQGYDLPCSIGVGSSKLVAKIANDVGKENYRGDRPPNSIFVVPPGGEAEFLAPLPVRSLIGVGSKTAAKLQAFGFNTIGDVARRPLSELEQMLGNLGRWIHFASNGIDNRSVHTDHSFKSISKEQTFGRDLDRQDPLLRALLNLSEDVGRQLRKKRVFCGTVSIKFRTSDFTTCSRQASLSEPTNLDRTIFDSARLLFFKLWKPGRKVRLLGVGASNLIRDGIQIGLFNQGAQRIQETLDEIRGKFGKRSVRWALGESVEGGEIGEVNE